MHRGWKKAGKERLSPLAFSVGGAIMIEIHKEDIMDSTKDTKVLFVRGFPIDLHRRIRVKAVSEDKKMAECLAEIVEKGLKNDGTLPA